MSPTCGNNGGASSFILLDEVPVVEKEVRLSPQNIKSLAFWRARVGEIVTVGDPAGHFFRARLTSMTESGGRAVVFQAITPAPESLLRLDVYQALPEKERFELILQKLTEIGVYRIVPYLSERSTTLEERDAGQKKSHRWPDVLRRAAKQCRRGIIPELSSPLPLEEALAEAAQAELVLTLSEHEKGRGLKEFLAGDRKYSHISLFVGPEGGFSNVELEAMAAAGFVSLSLGPRILRTETAAIVAAALVQSYCGDLG
ncbi:MAG: 16S rRNA (uracil(1498)-N(3))-methyltransferase [Deltaproteobacteria bacterium]|nr:16S rRNA (uracil(1498)-N(3))-methyltransferase [Deltaproteobacteria bacterium]